MAKRNRFSESGNFQSKHLCSPKHTVALRINSNFSKTFIGFLMRRRFSKKKRHCFPKKRPCFTKLLGNFLGNILLSFKNTCVSWEFRFSRKHFSFKKWNGVFWKRRHIYDFLNNAAFSEKIGKKGVFEKHGFFGNFPKIAAIFEMTPLFWKILESGVFWKKTRIFWKSMEKRHLFLKKGSFFLSCFLAIFIPSILSRAF